MKSVFQLYSCCVRAKPQVGHFKGLGTRAKPAKYAIQRQSGPDNTPKMRAPYLDMASRVMESWRVSEIVPDLRTSSSSFVLTSEFAALCRSFSWSTNRPEIAFFSKSISV
uniref:Uncharacterized protein n=1 Tax=Rhodosorus marinus TaxID=101924 RepID=A0A7S3EMA3_9RHOD